MQVDANSIETIRIKSDSISVKLVIATGKEGDFYVVISPSANVSGYGKTKKEAAESFNENVQTFLADLMRLSKDERERELLNLGFHKERFKNKNFSKVYVDENGVLNHFDEGTVEKKILETSSVAA
ncbi:MAG: hypothetical protein ABI594_20615 [Ginsengibacter sp.]